MTQRGFQPSKIVHGDYVLGGATQLKGAPLVPDGQWDAWLPAPYDQSRNGFEPNDCVSCAISYAIETLIKKVYSQDQRFSRRWLAWATGTQARNGNDPATVCTFLGKQGDVHMTDWPDDFSNFYAIPPQNLYTLALEFLAQFSYDNQWVPATQQDMMDALTRSPLTVAGYAWEQNPQGLYYWPDGAEADHYFLIYGYDRNNCWKAYDTYADEHKKLVWDYPFVQIKEHALHNQVVSQDWFQKFVQFLREALGLDGNSLGAARSPKWPSVRRAFIEKNPECAVCGSKKDLNAHHQKPFHLHPELELDPKNLITLCRRCHFLVGHLDNWKSYNFNVVMDAEHIHTEILDRP